MVSGLTILGGLWAGWLVLRLEMTHSNQKDLRKRVTNVEEKVSDIQDREGEN